MKPVQRSDSGVSSNLSSSLIVHDLMVQTNSSVRRVEHKQESLRKTIKALAIYTKEVHANFEIIREGIKALAANGLTVSRAKCQKYFPFRDVAAMDDYVAQDPQCVLLIHR